MKPRFLKMAGFLCLALIFLLAGCQPAKTAAAPEEFTFETFAQVNALSNVLGKYKSARVESTYYEPSSNNGEWTSYQYKDIFVNGDKGIARYSIWESGKETAVFKDSAYNKYPDGTFGVVGFVGGDYYEEYYLPNVAGLIYVPYEGEKLLSNTVENGVRKLVIQANTEGSYGEYIGLPQGSIETIYELDLTSGLVLRASESIMIDGKKQLLAEGRILYGEDDAFEPEYVRLCRDMSETRTVHLVQNAGTPEEKTYTFTLPKKVKFIPEAFSEFEMYTDPAYTVPHEGSPAGEYPDETTLYIKLY